jgi:hypothetical protein
MFYKKISFVALNRPISMFYKKISFVALNRPISSQENVQNVLCALKTVWLCSDVFIAFEKGLS